MPGWTASANAVMDELARQHYDLTPMKTFSLDESLAGIIGDATFASIADAPTGYLVDLYPFEVRYGPRYAALRAFDEGFTRTWDVKLQQSSLTAVRWILDFIETYKPLTLNPAHTKEAYAYHKLVNNYRDNDSVVYHRNARNFFKALNGYGNLQGGDKRRFKQALMTPHYLLQTRSTVHQEGTDFMWAELYTFLAAAHFVVQPTGFELSQRQQEKMQRAHEHFCATFIPA